jgi:hypothetical protein
MGPPSVVFVFMHGTLATSLWTVVERAGYRVAPLPSSYWDKLYSAGEIPNPGHSLSRRVSWYSAECDVFVKQESVERSGRTDILTIIDMFQYYDDLSQSLGRIFVASGARPLFKPREFDRLFYCEKGHARSLIDRLARMRQNFYLDSWYSLVPDGGPSDSTINCTGIFRCRKTQLRFWLGPALNAENGLECDFLAFGRLKSQFFGRSLTDRLLSNLSRELARLGAIEMQIKIWSEVWSAPAIA